MSCNYCNNAQGLSLLDTSNDGPLYNTYNPPKLFIPLTSQFMHKINKPTLQQTVVQNNFTENDPTLAQQTTANSLVSTSKDLTLDQSQILSTLADNNEKDESKFVSSLQSGIYSNDKNIGDVINTTETQPNLTDKKWTLKHHPELGSILVQDKHEDEDSSEDGSEQDDNMIDGILFEFKKNFQNEDESLNILEYAKSWDKILSNKEDMKELLIEFRDKAVEMFGVDNIEHFENNIMLNESSNDLKDIMPDVHEKLTLAEFYEHLKPKSGEVLYMCKNGNNIQKAIKGKCNPGFTLFKYEQPHSIKPSM